MYEMLKARRRPIVFRRLVTEEEARERHAGHLIPFPFPDPDDSSRSPLPFHEGICLGGRTATCRRRCLAPFFSRQIVTILSLLLSPNPSCSIRYFHAHLLNLFLEKRTRSSAFEKVPFSGADCVLTVFLQIE